MRGLTCWFVLPRIDFQTTLLQTVFVNEKPVGLAVRGWIACHCQRRRRGAPPRLVRCLRGLPLRSSRADHPVLNCAGSRKARRCEPPGPRRAGRDQSRPHSCAPPL